MMGQGGLLILCLVVVLVVGMLARSERCAAVVLGMVMVFAVLLVALVVSVLR